MRALIVFAHPERQSFSAALKNEAVSTLTRLGYEVEVSDLYAMGWKPALGPAEFDTDRANPEYLDLSREQEHAFARDSHSSDVKREQDKVAAASLVLFHFPVWWFSMPAMLKGWVDRVFSRGFAYSAGHKYECHAELSHAMAVDARRVGRWECHTRRSEARMDQCDRLTHPLKARPQAAAMEPLGHPLEPRDLWP